LSSTSASNARLWVICLRERDRETKRQKEWREKEREKERERFALRTSREYYELS
jgi:hypothetical protein